MALVRVVILCHWRVPVLALRIHIDEFEFSCELIGQTHHITGPAVSSQATMSKRQPTSRKPDGSNGERMSGFFFWILTLISLGIQSCRTRLAIVERSKSQMYLGKGFPFRCKCVAAARRISCSIIRRRNAVLRHELYGAVG